MQLLSSAPPMCICGIATHKSSLPSSWPWFWMMASAQTHISSKCTRTRTHARTHARTHTLTHLMENCKILVNCKWLGTHAAYKRSSLSKQHNFSRQRPYHTWTGACNSSHGWPEEDSKSYFHLATLTDCRSTGASHIQNKMKTADPPSTFIQSTKM